MPEVPAQPLLAQHRDKCGQQRHEQTCIQKVRGCDDFCGGAIPHRGSSGVFVRNNGSVEAEEDRSEVGFGPFGRIRLEFRLDVDDEGGADSREQTGLGALSTLCIDNRKAKTHENQCGIEVLVVLLHVVGVVFHRLSFVHGEEVNPGIVVLDRLEIHPQGLLDAIWSQLVDPCDDPSLKRTIEDRR